MRTEYKRDMNHNYLILTGDERIDTDSYHFKDDRGQCCA